MVSEIWKIKITLGSFSVLSVFGASLLALFETYIGDRGQAYIRRTLQSRWELVRTHRLREFPEALIEWLLDVTLRFNRISHQLANNDLSRTIAYLSLPFFFIFPSWYVWRAEFFSTLKYLLVAAMHNFSVENILVVSIFLFAFFLLFVFIFFWVGFDFSESLILFILLPWICLFIYLIVIWLKFCSMASIYYAPFIMFMVTPVFYWYFMQPLLAISRSSINYDIQKFIEKYGPICGMSTMLSFSTTLLFMMVGHVTNPTAPLPQSMQMLAANVVFDGMTIAVSLALLKWAVAHQPIIRIPVAVTIDVVFAGVFAICSLYFGLLHSDTALSIQQVMRVLIAKSPTHGGFEMGPYFWVMHTTFIPTILYCSLIGFAWIAKATLWAATFCFGIGRTLDNPLKLTAALMGVISAYFGVLTYAVGMLEEFLRNHIRG